MAEPQPWVPTIDDLRVKLCYICREEEQADNPQEPRVSWVHPCSCTLIAHESCLLNWIQASQQDSSRAKTALKCPQCGATYEIESEKPLVLRFLNGINRSMFLGGAVVTGLSFSIVVASCGLGIYLLLTGLGVDAMRDFYGEEMFDILLSYDREKWPWHAYLNVPLIPLSLMATRVSYPAAVSVFPLFLAWTTSPPVHTDGFFNGRFRLTNPMAYDMQPLIRWPPSPLMITFLFPILSRLYRRTMTRFKRYVLGEHHREPAPARRIELALNEGGPLLQVRIAADLDHDDGQQQQQQQQPPAQNAPAAQNGGGGAAQEGEDPPADLAAVAEQVSRVTGSSLGRTIGGALLIPKISKWMGTLLFNLSQHSRLLRKFLALRPPLSSRTKLAIPFFNPALFTGQNTASFVGTNIQVALNLIFGGTKVWTEADPVWWRNSVGFGLFVLAKDCINILHVYLTKREIETRHIKSRTFKGIDLKELDLRDPPPSRQQQQQQQQGQT